MKHSKCKERKPKCIIIVLFFQDSYVLDYFYDLGTYMKVGPPVYFVTTSGFNFSNLNGQNKVCGGWGCNVDSLTQQLYFASQEPER